MNDKALVLFVIRAISQVTQGDKKKGRTGVITRIGKRKYGRTLVN